MIDSKEIETCLKLYFEMLKIRIFEEKVAELVAENKITTPCHLYIGQEAIAAGVCSALCNEDWVFSTHRSHGHYLAKGGDINKLMAELFTKTNGCCKGRGGSMHIADPEVGLPGSTAIVSGTIPIAVGAALAFKTLKSNAVSVAFFGDGATNEGVFYESLNFAALKKLPVIFVCENNLYSTHMPIEECLSNPNPSYIAEALNIPSKRIDGNNALEVYNHVSEAVNTARSGLGPFFIEAKTYRWRGHVGPNDDIDKGLRSQEELAYWMDQCPIKTLERSLLEHSPILQHELHDLHEKALEDVEESLVFSLNGQNPEGSCEELMKWIFKDN